MSKFGELLGVGMGVAAVRMMTGGGRLPRPSRCPLGVTAKEYIFISGGGEATGVYGALRKGKLPTGSRPQKPHLCQVSTGTACPAPSIPAPITHHIPVALRSLNLSKSSSK